MPNSTEHPKQAISELADGRPGSDEVRAHLDDCEECRDELESLRWIKKLAAERLPMEKAPDSLRARVLESLDAEDARAASASLPRQPRARRFRPAWAAALVLAIAGAGLLYLWLRPPDLPSQVARDYGSFKSERILLQMSTDDGRALESFFVHRGISFPTRVLDLGMMEFDLVGGRVHELDGMPSAAFVYRGPDGKFLVCQMYPKTALGPPPGATLREHDGIRFFVYRRGKVTTVFWDEGTVTCVLSGDFDAEEVVQLAFAKAMKVSA